MAVRDALLALLAGGSRYGYQLKAEFEHATGERWPLNIGQVYTTLQRLARDELVQPDGDPDKDGRQRYVLTPVGEDAMEAWLATPVENSGPGRDELTMKLLIAVATNDEQALELLDAQRTASMSKLQSLTVQKAAGGEQRLAVQMQIDRTVLLVESEIRWLDLCEQRLEAAGFSRKTAPSPGRISAKDKP